jgi:hypothetical protein
MVKQMEEKPVTLDEMLGIQKIAISAKVASDFTIYINYAMGSYPEMPNAKEQKTFVTEMVSGMYNTLTTAAAHTKQIFSHFAQTGVYGPRELHEKLDEHVRYLEMTQQQYNRFLQIVN